MQSSLCVCIFFTCLIVLFNIVDIINQSNLAEDLAGTKKLGQTMASLSYSHDYGKFDMYLMSNFQERLFSGGNGRPRLVMEIDKNTVTYESSAKDKKLDFAIRYSTVLDDLDIGLSHFYGNNRAPELKANSSTLKFDPFYSIVSQTGLDIQSTKGSWLYKLESISLLSPQINLFVPPSCLPLSSKRFPCNFISLSALGSSTCSIV